ncbi:MAG: hypothetical protein ISP86_04960 [Shewanellaceae bacterium]|nr:hypothetical protein [Shewanellaceae bacterium]
MPKIYNLKESITLNMDIDEERKQTIIREIKAKLELNKRIACSNSISFLKRIHNA